VDSNTQYTVCANMLERVLRNNRLNCFRHFRRNSFNRRTVSAYSASIKSE
jgi:hypothetical protein